MNRKLILISVLQRIEKSYNASVEASQKAETK